MTGDYWRGAVEDQVMQDEHEFIWRAMLETIDVDLTGARVLDVGCNQGGFLRLLADNAGIAAGYGYDPADGAIADARRLAGDRPLTFETAETVPAGWHGFDVAFSHEVLYLVKDLTAHAEAIFQALAPGRPYFAVIGVHGGSRLMAAWHAASTNELRLPPIRDLDEVADTFEAAGFEVQIGRLRIRFVPAAAHRRGRADRGQLD